MKGTVSKTAEARLDLVEIMAHIARSSVTTARRFRKAADATFRELAAMPGIGESCPTRNHELAGLRCAMDSGFPHYLIFYRPLDRGIEIVRVVHGTRDVRTVLGLETPSEDA
jgi:toxin ParE1/3/4